MSGSQNKRKGGSKTMSKQYETVIGLEVHVELATKTKIFCGCSTAFGGAPNTHTCPVCTGMPGSLPVLNKKVVEYALRVGLAANCKINQFCKFDRKNYFYPDNPQNYQISQLYLPICHDGYVEIDTAAGKKKIGIHEIHMEEDAGKLIHDEWEDCSLVDYNRSGVPLIEIVSEPDMRIRGGSYRLSGKTAYDRFSIWAHPTASCRRARCVPMSTFRSVRSAVRNSAQEPR